jgi:hypothetical protein
MAPIEYAFLFMVQPFLQARILRRRSKLLATDMPSNLLCFQTPIFVESRFQPEEVSQTLRKRPQPTQSLGNSIYGIWVFL